MAGKSEIKAAAMAMRNSMADGGRMSPNAYWTRMAALALAAAERAKNPNEPPTDPDRLIGLRVSVDMSTEDNDDSFGDRIFARVVEWQEGNDGRPHLICEFESDNRVRGDG